MPDPLDSALSTEDEPAIVVERWGPLWRAAFHRLGKTSRFYARTPERARRKAEDYRAQEARFLGPLLIGELARRGLGRPPMLKEELDYATVEARFPDRALIGGDDSCSVYEEREDGHFLIVEPVDERRPLTVLSFPDGASQLLYEATAGLARFASRAEALAHLQARRDARHLAES